MSKKDTALVVVNLLVDMIEHGVPFPMPPEYEAVYERTVAFVNRLRDEGYTTIFIQDQHRPGDKEFTDFSAGQPHAVRDTEGAQLMPDLLPVREGEYVVGKRRFSAFFATDLDLYLREEGIWNLVFVGRPSNVCALYSAVDARMRRYRVAAISDCLYSKTCEMHERSMAEFAETLGPVVTGEEFLAGEIDWKVPEPEGGKVAVLVVNVNKDLVENGLPEGGSRVAARVGNMRELLEIARGKGMPILYAMDAHRENDWEFGNRAPHGVSGTAGAEVVDELAPQAGDPVFHKRDYDAFYETGLDPYLREEGIERLVIIGGPTNVDVRHTVVSAYNYRYRPIVIKDCTDASTEAYHERTLQDMFFSWRMTLDQFRDWAEEQG